MELSEGFRKNLALLGICVLLAGGITAVHNLVTPEEPTRVGLVEVETKCMGLDAGVCLGVERQTHTTYNYDNYTEVSPGDPNYYRKVESELMLRAHSVCTEEMEGFEWTSEVTFEGRTAEEWRQNENIQLLPCEETYFRQLEAES